jgi:tetratricopeptide (TPR) repeat protein
VKPWVSPILVAALALTLTLALTGKALGAPSRWTLARDPSERKIERALTRAIQARASRDLAREALPVAEGLFALRAATVLEMAGGEALARPEVWFFLGDALVVADHGEDARGRRILQQALAADPDSPSAARALRDIAVASSRLSEFEPARSASSEALRLEWDQAERAELLLVRAGATMSLGELSAARRDYTTVLETASDSEFHALAKWGLAAALARDGDLPDALRYAREAAGTRFSDSQGNVVTVLELPSVHLAPAYDAFYYRALAAMAKAPVSETPEDARSELEWAVSLWKRYLALAREAGDRYVENAEQSLRSCERRLSAERPGHGSGGSSRRPGARTRQ